MNKYPKRLIEVDLPIRRISEHARREKSIRHGHISTLHIWWARRPLAACRAVICASLWPDPVDPLCPESFRENAREWMKKWAFEYLGLLSNESYKRFIKFQREPEILYQNIELRWALLDFIADFSIWENSTRKEYLLTSQNLTQIAHMTLGGEQNTYPLVIDPFAGGGSIPIEALRVGAHALASDLNPVAFLLNKVILEYIPKYGKTLADEIRKAGQLVKNEAEYKVAEFYPKGPDGSIPIAYFWARMIVCEGPECGVKVPIIRSLILAKKKNYNIKLHLVPLSNEKGINFNIVQSKSKDKGEGTVKRGSVTCPVCGYTTAVSRVREQLIKQEGGADSSILIAVVSRDKNGKHYRLPNKEDYAVVEKIKCLVNREEIIPKIELPLMSGVFNVPIYGIKRWDLLFSARQLFTANKIGESIHKIIDSLEHEEDFVKAISVLLFFARNKYLDFRTTLCAWIASGEKIGHTFGRQALGMIFDWVEGTPFGDISGSWERTIEFIAQFIEAESILQSSTGNCLQADAQKHPLPDDFANAFITDPPYYNAVPYADLSDFFYIWLKKDLECWFPDLFMKDVTPKEEELCEMKGWDPLRYHYKDALFYEQGMKKALNEGRRICVPWGIGVIVFAHKSTAGWESLLSALIESGWIVTASWPIDTERSGRLRAMQSAALASSIHLVCRPRENPEGATLENYIGDWREVLHELPIRIHSWLTRLAVEGVVGADAIFACLGPALEIFSQYSLIEKANGERVTLKEFLEYVWSSVAKEALHMIFTSADVSVFEEDARLTAMWLWTISTSKSGEQTDNQDNLDYTGEIDIEDDDYNSKKLKGFFLEYDAARKIAQGLGIHLEALSSVVEVKGETARLIPVAERVSFLFASKRQRNVTERSKNNNAQLNLDILDDHSHPNYNLDDEIEHYTLKLGTSALDRLHQSMLLFAEGRSEALKRFLVTDGHGKDQRFWNLAQAFSALYPCQSDEKRWVDGVLARKKGLGF